MADLRQMAVATVPNDTARGATAVFARPTQAGSLVVVIATGTELDNEVLYGPSGFTVAPITRSEDLLTLAAWYRPNCPPLSSVGVATGRGSDAMLVRAIEYTGAAAQSVLDRVSVSGNSGGLGSIASTPQSGVTAETSQPNEIVVGVIANRFGSTRQSGFGGGLALLADSTTPDSDPDYRRARLTVHHALTTQTTQAQITGRLSAARDWVAAVLTFRAATTGPVPLVSIEDEPMFVFGGEGELTVFGPLVSTEDEPMFEFGGEGYIGPFVGQVQLGGPDGLLLGPGTPYRISRIEGLAGHDIRTSDTEQSRGDGDQRGTDRQTARLVLIELNFHDDTDPTMHEQLLVDLYAALVPRPDEDFPVIYRQPGRPLQQIYARPGRLMRDQTADDMILHEQTILLRAADPRIYGHALRTVVVPATPAGATDAVAVSAVNEGNARAYPVIRVRNVGTIDVTSVELVNASADVVFRLQATLLPGAELVGDMPAVVTAAPRLKVTAGGQGVFSAWTYPRDPFFIAPAPEVPGGANAVYLRVLPAGAQVSALIEYRDTSST
jgi:hypothetical protein